MDILPALGAEGDVSYHSVESLSANATFIDAEDGLSVSLEAVFEESRGVADEVYGKRMVLVCWTPELALYVVTFMYSEAAIKIGGLEAYDSVAHTAPYQQVTCGVRGTG